MNAPGDAFRTGVGYAEVPASVVTVEGPDAQSFLQSLVSQDLDGIAVGETRRSLLLQPQGKLIASFRILATGPEAFLLVTDAGIAEALSSALKRFKIRVKVEIADVTRDRVRFAVRGPASPTIAPELPTGEWRRIHAPWPGNDGFDLVGPVSEGALAARALEAAGADPVDVADYEVLRVEHGVPRHDAELDERVIPQEAGLERDSVSFTKGCFVGQELVCRIDSRGHVNRHLRLLVDQEPDDDGLRSYAPGTEVIDGDRVVGAITSAVWSPLHGAVVALAYVRRETPLGGIVTVAGRRASVSPRPGEAGQ